MSKPSQSIPYNSQYLRNFRNDWLRHAIWAFLQEGDFEFQALLFLLNFYMKDSEIENAGPISRNGLIQMLARNCSGAWQFEGDTVRKNPNYCGYLQKDWPFYKDPCRIQVTFLVNLMIEDGELFREKYGQLLLKNPAKFKRPQSTAPA